MCHKCGTSVVHKVTLTRFFDIFCIMHLMYVSAENTKEASHVFEYFVYYALNVCIYP